MDKTFSWTVDVEGDWGGRIESYDGLEIGLPKIFKLFKRHNVKGLFFISTEILDKRMGVIQDIISEGHEIGNHGHFHIPFKEPWRAVQNKHISDRILMDFTGQTRLEYRAPKFSYEQYGQPYSYREGHVGLLKHMWFGGKLTGKETFYLHPFDIVGGKNPPNIFSRIWYRHPKKAYETLSHLIRNYPGSSRLAKA